MDPAPPASDPTSDLAAEAAHRAPADAADWLSEREPAAVVAALAALNPMVAQQILDEVEPSVRDLWLAAATPAQAGQWTRNLSYPEDSVGWLMVAPAAVFRPEMTVSGAVEILRKLTKKTLVTYGYVTDTSNRLIGILVMRDLLLAEPGERLDKVMQTGIFSLRPEMELTEAMRATLNRHFPVYPVCDENGCLLGLVRGQNLFEARAIELSAQAGSMVGVDNEERVSTPFWRSFRLRHPWLQFNLLTAFVAAAVVGYFEETLAKVVLLAVFLPVLSGQSGNTGCQSLAVCLRALTLGDVRSGEEKKVLMKEAMLGLLNGLLVGIVAGAAMMLQASRQGNPSAALLGLVVVAAMTLSCVVSGVAGVMIPLILRRCGADPAAASSIFLTTATDVVSMGTFLGLATWWIV
ncbi:MAG: magnesium transporter [Verrucomicrobiales bacterium]